MPLDPIYFCKDCQQSTHWLVGNKEYYMVNEDVWAAAGMEYSGGMLCVGCIENRLHRKLNRGDFTDCPVNTEFPKSDRLQDRIENAI